MANPFRIFIVLAVVIALALAVWFSVEVFVLKLSPRDSAVGTSVSSILQPA